MKKIGALWKGKNDSLTGSLDLTIATLRIGVFANTEKKGRQPDYNIVIMDKKTE